DRDAAEVQGDRGGALLLDPRDVVDADAPVGQQLLGTQRLDLAHRPDQGRLARAEATGHEDLESDGRLGPPLVRLTVPVAHASPPRTRRHWVAGPTAAVPAPRSDRG